MPKNKLKEKKAYIKFLAHVNHSKLRKSALGFCPDSVIKGVCNAARNVREGDVPLSANQKKQLRQHHKDIETLISKKKSIADKRKILQKGGGIFAVLPMLLSSALEAIGSRFISK